MSKKIVSFIISFVMLFGLVCGGQTQVFAYNSGEIEGTTGLGTAEDPVIVDNFTELKDALQYNGTLYIQVNSFQTDSNQGGYSYYALKESDYVNNEPVISQIGTKYLELNTNVDIRINSLDSEIATLIEVNGALVLSGKGSLNGGLSGNNTNSLLFVKSTGSLTCDGPDIVVRQAIARSANAITVNAGNCVINSGNIWGRTSNLYYESSYSFFGNAVLARSGILTINGGYFTVDSSGVENPKDHGLYISKNADVTMNGGVYDGITSEGADISSYIGNGKSIFDYDSGSVVSGDTADIPARIQVAEESPIIPFVNVDVKEPAAEDKPGTPAAGSPGITVTDFEWYDYNGILMKEGDTFVEGKDYMLHVLVRPEEGLRFQAVPVDGYVMFNLTRKGTIYANAVDYINYYYIFTASGVIPKADIANASVTGIQDVIYNGEAFCPVITVQLAGNTLELNKDYTVEYKNNINAGTATVIITGIGEYVGTTEKTFTIKKKALSKASIKLSKTSYVYNGKAKKPSVTVKVGSTELTAKDYSVTYAKGRKNVGEYSVKVTLKGNYSGSKTASFKINPLGTTISKLTAGSKSVTVKWKKQPTKMSESTITGYQIQAALTKNFKTIASKKTVKGASKTSGKLTGLKTGKNYYVRIRTYKTVSGKKYYSAWSKAKTVKVS